MPSILARFGSALRPLMTLVCSLVASATRIEGGRKPGRAPMGTGRQDERAGDGTGGRTLLGRKAESAVLETLLTEAFGGQSRVVVLRGEAGVGKTFLLKKVSDRLDGWQIAKAVGVESEIELAYSGLHQLCVPVIDRLERLPEPQREALSTVFGLSAGPTPDRFL